MNDGLDALSGIGRYLIIVIIAFVLVISMVFAFKAGEKAGKLQVINDVKEQTTTIKGNINDLIKDFKELR